MDILSAFQCLFHVAFPSFVSYFLLLFVDTNYIGLRYHTRAQPFLTLFPFRPFFSFFLSFYSLLVFLLPFFNYTLLSISFSLFLLFFLSYSLSLICLFSENVHLEHSALYS